MLTQVYLCFVQNGCIHAHIFVNGVCVCVCACLLRLTKHATESGPSFLGV